MALARLEDAYGNEIDREQDNPSAPPPPPSAPPAPTPNFSNPGGTLSSSNDIARINQQYGGQGVEKEDADKLERLRQQGTQSNGESYESYLKEIEAKQQRRTAPTSDRRFDSQSSAYNQTTNQLTPQAIAAVQSGAGRTSFNYGNPGDQFDDPYTKAFEDLLKQQLASIQQPQSNPALDQLLQFLNTQFAEKSQNPGYSTSEQALLRTQALDPIERDRSAAMQRSRERTAASGYLPSSGIDELRDQQIDLGYDQLRGAAQRDLGINAINRRDQNLAQALTLGQLAGIQIPQMQRAEDASRRSEAIGYANSLYQLPRQAMADAQSVISGSPLGADMFSKAVQLLTNQQEQQRYNQAQGQQMWYQIGQMLAQLFGG